MRIIESSKFKIIRKTEDIPDITKIQRRQAVGDTSDYFLAASDFEMIVKKIKEVGAHFSTTPKGNY